MAVLFNDGIRPRDVVAGVLGVSNAGTPHPSGMMFAGSTQNVRFTPKSSVGTNPAGFTVVSEFYVNSFVSFLESVGGVGGTPTPFDSYTNGTTLNNFRSNSGGPPVSAATLNTAVTTGSFQHWIQTYPDNVNVTPCVVYQNGVRIVGTTPTAGGAAPTGGSFAIGQRDGSTTIHKYAYVYDRGFSPGEAAWIRAEPYAMFVAPGPKILYFDLGSPIAPITGTLTVTEANDTLTAAGAVGASGTLAVTDDADTLVASGTYGTTTTTTTVGSGTIGRRGPYTDHRTRLAKLRADDDDLLAIL